MRGDAGSRTMGGLGYLKKSLRDRWQESMDDGSHTGKWKVGIMAEANIVVKFSGEVETKYDL